MKNTRVVGRTIWRIPDKGPVIPRLRPEDARTNAVGFYAQLCAREDDE
jgi:hypothetical protein